MLVVPVYNMVLTPDATLYFQMEQLKKNAGGKGIAVGEKVILIVAKKNEKAGEMTEESFYHIGVAGVLTEIDPQGFAAVRTQYRVDLESVSINADGTVKLNIHRRPEIDDLDRAAEQEKLKALKEEMRNFSAGFQWADSAKYYIDQVDSIGMAACAFSPWLKIGNEERYAILAPTRRSAPSRRSISRCTGNPPSGGRWSTCRRNWTRCIRRMSRTCSALKRRSRNPA